MSGSVLNLDIRLRSRSGFLQGQSGFYRLPLWA
jgi:hypothetical protein